MANGAVRLQLFMGPGVPIPAPREVIEAVQEVKVESNSGETQSGFELSFRLSNRSPLHTLFLLTGGSSIPIFRVVIAVTDGRPDERAHGRGHDAPRGAVGRQPVGRRWSSRART